MNFEIAPGNNSFTLINKPSRTLNESSLRAFNEYIGSFTIYLEKDTFSKLVSRLSLSGLFNIPLVGL